MKARPERRPASSHTHATYSTVWPGRIARKEISRIAIYMIGGVRRHGEYPRRRLCEVRHPRNLVRATRLKGNLENRTALPWLANHGIMIADPGTSLDQGHVWLAVELEDPSARQYLSILTLAIGGTGCCSRESRPSRETVEAFRPAIWRAGEPPTNAAKGRNGVWPSRSSSIFFVIGRWAINGVGIAPRRRPERGLKRPSYARKDDPRAGERCFAPPWQARPWRA